MTTKNIKRYDELATQYDHWYDQNEALYMAEVEAIRDVLPGGRGIEIGAGTGRFTKALGIEVGVEPAPGMRVVAKENGIELIDAVAENVPFPDGHFDYALFLTSLEFVEDKRRALREAKRVIRSGGGLIIAFLNAASAEGKALVAHKDALPFFEFASFFTTAALTSLVTEIGFSVSSFTQVVEYDDSSEQQSYKVEDGSGEGLYTVLVANRP